MKKKTTVEAKKEIDGAKYTEAELCDMRDMFLGNGWKLFSVLLKGRGQDEIEVSFSNPKALSLEEYQELHSFYRAVQTIGFYKGDIDKLIEEFEKEKQEEKQEQKTN